MRTKILTLMFGFLCFGACKSAKYTAATLPESRILFGNGGGFAGIENTYYLLENGQVFAQKGASHELNALKNAKKKAAQEAFATCDALHLDAMTLNMPGNTYSFIERRTSDGKSHRITWGNTAPSAEILAFHTSLCEMIK